MPPAIHSPPRRRAKNTLLYPTLARATCKPPYDAEVVSGFDRISDLARQRQRVVNGDRALGQALRQVVALDDFHHEGVTGIGVLQAVDVGNVGVVERLDIGSLPTCR